MRGSSPQRIGVLGYTGMVNDIAYARAMFGSILRNHGSGRKKFRLLRHEFVRNKAVMNVPVRGLSGWHTFT